MNFFNGKEKYLVTEECQLIYVEGTAELEGHLWHLLNHNQVGKHQWMRKPGSEGLRRMFTWSQSISPQNACQMQRENFPVQKAG